mmetsp:Transcript_16196/g.22774  ORF Transcript_16196/g.22774 Transcript_16196/m.22774 type:complete len:82 (+) Transcript_16196:278-523(+)
MLSISNVLSQQPRRSFAPTLVHRQPGVRRVGAHLLLWQGEAKLAKRIAHGLKLAGLRATGVGMRESVLCAEKSKRLNQTPM